jgi:hypothetical protein
MAMRILNPSMPLALERRPLRRAWWLSAEFDEIAVMEEKTKATLPETGGLDGGKRANDFRFLFSHEPPLVSG